MRCSPALLPSFRFLPAVSRAVVNSRPAFLSLRSLPQGVRFALHVRELVLQLHDGLLQVVAFLLKDRLSVHDMLRHVHGHAQAEDQAKSEARSRPLPFGQSIPSPPVDHVASADALRGR